MKRASGMARFWAGLLIGAAGIAPGVSGGVIAVSLGLYRPMIEALAGMNKNMRKSARFLSPIVAGIGAGLLVAGYMLMAFMESFAAEALYLFAGLVLGSLPALVRKGGGWRLRRLPPILLGAAAFWLMSRLLPAALEVNALDWPRALACGAVLAVGTVVPGVSSSFLLMRLGMYRAYLGVLGEVRVGEAAIIALGFAGTAAILIGIVNRVFRKFESGAYLAIAGFTFMSVMDALPPVSAAISPTACLLLMPLGAGLGLILRGNDEETTILA